MRAQDRALPTATLPPAQRPETGSVPSAPAEIPTQRAAAPACPQKPATADGSIRRGEIPDRWNTVTLINMRRHVLASLPAVLLYSFQNSVKKKTSSGDISVITVLNTNEGVEKAARPPPCSSQTRTPDSNPPHLLSRCRNTDGGSEVPPSAHSSCTTSATGITNPSVKTFFPAFPHLA